MEKLTLFGIDNIDLINTIINQIKFNTTLIPELLYDEITDNLNKIKNYSIVTTPKIIPIDKPQKIHESSNFKYILQDGVLILINKYH